MAASGPDGTAGARRGTLVNEMSGNVSGQTVLANVVHGGVNLHQTVATDSQPTVTPRQLPLSPAVFTDRVRELDELDRVMGSRSGRRALVVITGLGGVGKTTLALRWLESTRSHFPDGHLYADLGAEGSAQLNPAEVLGRFLRALGVPPQRVPVGTAEQSALFRSLTARSEEPYSDR